MVREVGLIFTVAILNELNHKSYTYTEERFTQDSKVLEKLLKVIDMEDIEENLNLVKSKCIKELPLDQKFKISLEDKKAILRYL